MNAWGIRCPPKQATRPPGSRDGTRHIGPQPHRPGSRNCFQGKRTLLLLLIPVPTSNQAQDQAECSICVQFSPIVAPTRHDPRPPLAWLSRAVLPPALFHPRHLRDTLLIPSLTPTPDARLRSEFLLSGGINQLLRTSLRTLSSLLLLALACADHYPTLPFLLMIPRSSD